VAVKVRRQARVVAFQTLFELDLVHHNPETVLLARLEETPLPEDAQQFARILVQGVVAHQTELDLLIRSAAPQWPIQQMAKADVNILRLAVFELSSAQAPLKVVINEAVELAKTYGGESSPRFVNGVLGTVALRLPAEGSKSSRQQDARPDLGEE
jgi:transcription antitermination protein NusB